MPVSGQNFCKFIQWCPLLFPPCRMVLERGLVICLRSCATSASFSLWWSMLLYSHLSNHSLFCTLLHLWHGCWRKYQAEVSNLCSLDPPLELCFATRMTTGELIRQGHATILDYFWEWAFYFSRSVSIVPSILTLNSGLDHHLMNLLVYWVRFKS